MMESLSSFTDWTFFQLEVFFLVLVRVSAIVFLLPFFSSGNVDPKVKAGLSFFLAYIFFPTIPAQVLPMPEGGVGFFMMVLWEVSTGLIIGMAANLLFLAFQIAGEIMDREIGLSMVQLMNPITEEMSTGFAFLQLMIFSVILLLSNGHFYFIQAIHESFVRIPIAGLEPDLGRMSGLFTTIVSDAFVIGLKAASPLLAVTLLSSLGMAFMARIMPQMNIWLVAVPLKIFVGVITLIYTLPMLYKLFFWTFERLQQQIHLLIRLGASG
jgi:flagellar biosynthesis protein FliR